MKAICEVAQRHAIVVIEDCAQAIGATQDGVKCGNFGEFGCFSFYPTKNLGAFGDAGLVTTNNAKLAELARLLRVHGQESLYCYREVGGNFRMDAIQGAVLNIKLKHLDRWNHQRRAHAALYDEVFKGSPVQPPKIEAGNESIYHQYTVKTPDRDNLQKWLAERDISAAVFYPKCLHLQQCFASLGYRQGDFPVAENVAKHVLSLPVYAELEPAQIEHVAETILKFYQ
jgi:dTDP-4-amino-4,6-dideoxygalactose transaminase